MELHSSDVMMFVRSRKVVSLVTAPDAHNAVMGSLEQHGYYTFAVAMPYGGHSTGGGTAFFDGGIFANKPIYDEELPEDQADAVRRAFRTVQGAGRKLHLVDIGKESAFRRVIEEHLHHLRKFPVLVRPDGRRLEGPEECTESRLKAFLED